MFFNICKITISFNHRICVFYTHIGKSVFFIAYCGMNFQMYFFTINKI